LMKLSGKKNEIASSHKWARKFLISRSRQIERIRNLSYREFF
jgi:hypothetical protein